MIRRVLLAAALLAASLGFEGARAQSVTEAQALVHVAIVDGIFRSAALGREVEIEL